MNKRQPIKGTKQIYQDVADLYANKKCKICYGRGLITITPPKQQKQITYCQCVERNLNKYG